MRELLGKILVISGVSLREAVAIKDPQKMLLNKFRSIVNTWIPSNFPGEPGYKYFVLSDGTMIPVKYSHDDSTQYAKVDYDELMASGASGGYVDPDVEILYIGADKKLTKQQIGTVVKMIIPHRVKRVQYDIGGGFGSGTVLIKSPKEVEYLLTYGTLDETIEESSIDYPKTDLDLSIWDKEEDGYHLRPEVQQKIIQVLDAYEPIDLLDMAREIRIVGSIGTNTYTEDADIDVHIAPKDFSGWDDDKVKVVKDWFNEHAQELDAFVGNHPIEVYVQLNPPQDLMSDSAYNFLEDQWLVGPKIVSKDYDPYKDFSHIADDIRTAVENADILMGELKRDVIDFDVIKQAMGEMPSDVRQKLQITLKNKLEEIEKDIEALYYKRKEWTNARKNASKPTTPEQALQDVELAKKWKDTNATFKFINRYRYLATIEELEQLIAHDGDVSKEDVDVIRNIVGM